MNLSWLKTLLAEPLAKNLDLDSALATDVHRQLIRQKPFLKKLYEKYYGVFVDAAKMAPGDGVFVEIGSGSGFLKDYIPDLISVDLRPGADVDMIASALSLPVADGSVSGVFLLNVLHHLDNAEAFFSEIDRILISGGICVMIEPYVSTLSRLIYTHLHHEPFDPAQKEWSFKSEGIMSSANDALPWIIFERDRLLFEDRFPALKVVDIDTHTVLAYLLSGGLSFRCPFPAAAFRPIWTAEKILGKAGHLFNSMMTIKLQKR